MNIYFKEKLGHIVFLTAACLSIVAVVLICLFLFVSGVPSMLEVGLDEFLLGQKWAPTDSPALFGIFPMIIGSILVTLGATLIGAPLGIITAVYLSYYCPKKWQRLLRSSLSLLAGIPSIVYGFFGLMVLVPMMQSIFGTSGKNLLTASILLGIMILPTVINISESAIRAVPQEYYEGSLALGASHTRTVYRVILPAAKSGVLASVILGVGRAIGETMAVIMVAGNQPVIPNSILRGGRTLTANIVMEMGYAVEQHREVLIATGVVLFLFILAINGLFLLVKKKLDGGTKG